MSEYAVEVSHVSKRIGTKSIIQDLSFTVSPGEIYGFLGPNGAGKTTTIRMMVGLISMSSGDIRIGGRSIRSDRKGALSQVGAIVENPELYRYMTGRQNLLQFARMSMQAPDKSEIERIIQLVDLQESIDRRVRNYSLGMRQRLGIAQALLHRPSVLILDEPTNGLDPAGIRQLRDYLRELARQEGMAIIISSHLLAEIELICDRVIIIQQGRVVAEQPLKQEDADGQVTVDLEVEDAAELEKAASLLRGRGHMCHTDRATITLDTNRNEIPRIVEYLVHHQVGLLQVFMRKNRLEELYLKLTGEAQS
ncbi:ABC transporter ATP-binding protein [Paenibacillus filicis]|uniref:ABC transporter ATP-binding protein n=1 Tax=Paenibacillus filicis TaxID=669464 RepID=A0ABU9DED8_9BACL